jgi:cold shock CspA family protein
VASLPPSVQDLPSAFLPAGLTREDTMQTEPQICFDDIPIDEQVRNATLDAIADLERFSHRITRCHVVISQPHRHHQRGRLYSVRIDLFMPGTEIVVNRYHHLDHAHENVMVALRDAFLVARRLTEDHLHRLRGEEQARLLPLHGRVTQIFPLQGYGFIATPDGREVYFHRNAVSNRDYTMLDIGSHVTFGEEQGEKGTQATFVHLH